MPAEENTGGFFIDLNLPQVPAPEAVDAGQEGFEGIELNQPASAVPLAEATEQNTQMDIQSQPMQSMMGPRFS